MELQHRIDIAQEQELAIEIRRGYFWRESLENVEVRFERSRLIHIADVFTRPAETSFRDPLQARSINAAVLKYSELLFSEVLTDHSHDPDWGKPTRGN